MQQAFRAVLVRYSGLLGGKSARPIWGWRPPVAFSLRLSSCFLSVAGESVRVSFAFCLFSTNSNSPPPCNCLCSFLVSIFPHPPSARSIPTAMEWFRSSLFLVFGLTWLQTGTATVRSSLLFSFLSLDSQTPPRTPNSKPPLSA